MVLVEDISVYIGMLRIDPLFHLDAVIVSRFLQYEKGFGVFSYSQPRTVCSEQRNWVVNVCVSAAKEVYLICARLMSLVQDTCGIGDGGAVSILAGYRVNN